MDPNLLVRLFVPTRNERGRDGRGKVGETGTAFPVGNDLILTARHVVEPEDRDKKYPIQALWYDHPNAGPDEGWYSLPNDCVVWRGVGELDAALLRCPRPPAVRHFGLVSEEQPRYGLRWSSAGFPRASVTDKSREHASFGGEMYAMPSTASYFELDVRAPPSEEEDWCGSSGMPICRENSRVIIGVAKEVPRKFAAHKIHATPTWKLLAEPSFRKAIGFDDQQQRRVQFQGRLARIFAASPRAVAAVASRGGLPENAGAGQPDAATTASGLLGCSLVAAVACIQKAYDAIEIERNDGEIAELKGAAETLGKAAQLLVPCLYDDGLVNGIRALRKDGDVGIVELPCFFPTVAEIVMAAIDNRATEYLPRKSETHFPEGKWHLPVPPELGIASAVAQRAAIEESLIRKFTLGGWTSLHKQIDDYFYQFVDRSHAVERSDADRVRAVNSELTLLSRSHSYYLLYKLPADPQARSEMEAGLRELKSIYPWLFVLGLTDDPNMEIHERDTFGPFRMMLPMQG